MSALILSPSEYLEAASGLAFTSTTPEKAIEVDSVVLVEDNAFLLQALFLNFIAPERFQGNFAHAVNDPVPG